MKKVIIFLLVALIFVTCIVYYLSHKDTYYIIKSGDYYLVNVDNSGNVNITKGNKNIYLLGYYNTLGVFTSAECDFFMGKKLNDDYNLGYVNPILYQGVFYYSIEKVSLATAIGDPKYIKYLLDHTASGEILKDWWYGVPSQDYAILSVVVDISDNSVFPVQGSNGFTYYLSFGFSKFREFFNSIKIDNLFDKSFKKFESAD